MDFRDGAIGTLFGTLSFHCHPVYGPQGGSSGNACRAECAQSDGQHHHRSRSAHAKLRIQSISRRCAAILAAHALAGLAPARASRSRSLFRADPRERRAISSPESLAHLCRQEPIYYDNHFRPQAASVGRDFRPFALEDRLEPVYRWIDEVTETDPRDTVGRLRGQSGRIETMNCSSRSICAHV